MAELIKYSLEFPIRSSVTILYKRLSSPEGLAEWFADDVNIKGDDFIFFWDGASETATMLSKKKGEAVKFQWEDDAEEGLKTYFEIAL